ncbi:MAG: transposase [Candidatus Polarisedimenticolaceae bacterium]|nr:transposase [Candidatus Polarisedimenticolaceae bacterium]
MKRKTYNAVFKQETVKYIEENQLGISEASKKFGVGSTALRRWCSEFKVYSTQAFPGQGKLRADDEKVRQLTEENKRLRQECEILKKATVYFAKEMK